MCLKVKKTSYGFTLVELSIVLVIVALIIAGILVGQELIRSANVRAIITQVDRYNSAVNSFKIKFTQLPGDFNAATTYISASATNGDGNGFVFIGAPSTAPSTQTGQTEFAGFWNHLSSFSLINGNYNGTSATTTLEGNFPYLKTQNGGVLAYASHLDATNYYHLGLAPSASAALSGSVVFSPDVAYVIDQKMDDGLPASGSVRAVSAIDVFSATTDTPACIQTATAYNTVATTTIACQLRIKMM